MKTTVDFSVPSPYSQDLVTSSLTSFIQRASYRHQINFIRRNALPGDKLLDVGCGSGIFLSVAAQYFSNLDLYGLDYDHRLLEESSQRVTDCKFIQGSAEELPFDSGKFNFLTSFHNIEHLYNPELFIAEAERVLCNGGFLLVATPNPSSFVARQMRDFWPASLSQRPDHISLKTPSEWRTLFERFSFNVISEGTTFASSLPIVNRTPLKYLNQLCLFSFGNLPWHDGEAYHTILQKSEN
jgi:ubiquinone/menaquinone biosynthesis C-methylase UbiE